jgi:hypothetical protein
MTWVCGLDLHGSSLGSEVVSLNMIVALYLKKVTVVPQKGLLHRRCIKTVYWLSGCVMEIIKFVFHSYFKCVCEDRLSRVSYIVAYHHAFLFWSHRFWNQQTAWRYTVRKSKTQLVYYLYYCISVDDEISTSNHSVPWTILVFYS